MVKIKKEGILLKITYLEFENKSLLNPAVIREGDSVHVFYNTINKENNSSIGYCKLDGPLNITERCKTPFIVPEFDYESQGIEDVRISKINDLYYMTYTSYDGKNAYGVLATSKDLKNFKKQGIIVPLISYAEFLSKAESLENVDDNYYKSYTFFNHAADPEQKIKLWDKNIVFFPRRINGNIVILHRVWPGIQIVSVNNIESLNKEFWDDYFLNLQDHIVMDPIHPHEINYIGSGCPPIETGYGWLLIYHGVKNSHKGLVYSACAALLDLMDPTIEIARLPHPLFSPELEWELTGEGNNVVFPTGTALFGNTLFIYYGAADSCIACASVSLSELLKELLMYKK